MTDRHHMQPTWLALQRALSVQCTPLHQRVLERDASVIGLGVSVGCVARVSRQTSLVELGTEPVAQEALQYCKSLRTREVWR